MDLPLSICVLSALASGLHFGLRFAAAHRAGQNIVLAPLAHAAVSVALVMTAVMLDQSTLALGWLAVAGGSLMGLACGALWPVRAPSAVPALLPHSGD